MPPLTHTVQIQNLDRFYARLSALRGEPLAKTVQKSLQSALRKTVVQIIRGGTYFGGHGHGPHHGPPGRLLKAVDARAAKKRPGEMAAVKVGPGGKQGANKAWYAHFVVRGTKPHLITASGWGGGSATRVVRKANRGEALALTVAGTLVKTVNHPGARANPFINKGLRREELLKRQLVLDLIAASNPK